MIKEEEIAHYRNNVIKKYVDEVMKRLEYEEQMNKIEAMERKMKK